MNFSQLVLHLDQTHTTREARHKDMAMHCIQVLQQHSQLSNLENMTDGLEMILARCLTPAF